jgi:hypothetical protein
MDGGNALAELKDKLLKLERTLASLSDSMTTDIEAALALQKRLIPNRTPEVAGVLTHARYLSAQQIHSESFDLVPTRDGRELWIVLAWTESFGLSAVLLQALVHLQTKALVEGRPDTTPEAVFDELTKGLGEARRQGQYRLHVSRLNPSKLELSGCAVGQLPWLRRARAGGAWESMEPVGAEGLMQKQNLFESGDSARPIAAKDAHTFRFRVTPGDRLYLLGRSWAPQATLAEVLAAVAPARASPAKDLVEDMNALLLAADADRRARQLDADLTLIGLEVSPTKLHLA